MSDFVPGLALARAFYADVVAAILGDVRHSAALLGWGSDVLGLDSERSTDHGWGPRLQVFVDAADVEGVRAAVEAGLPDEFSGWPTRFGWDATPVSHHVDVVTLEEWLRALLGFDPRGGMSTIDWLTIPQQALLELTSGAVFHDGLDELEPLRARLAWYPDDVWLWLLACQWRRIDQEEPFAGRAAEVGDELGSRIIASRLVRDLVRLCFLLERRYAPYSKWLGSAFRQLDVHGAVSPFVLDVLTSPDEPARETAFLSAAQIVAARQNALGVLPHVDETIRSFHGRPFRVLGCDRFVDACLEGVRDSWLRGLPLVGAVDQWVDSTDVLSYTSAFRTTAALYREASS